MSYQPKSGDLVVYTCLRACEYPARVLRVHADGLIDVLVELGSRLRRELVLVGQDRVKPRES